ncbi:ribosome maturation factor RimM [Bacillus subtilis]|jgi:16S rRNA processing protein RimM|uniref:Ribosome maturation factor RimM n=5 Tax=Bacillus subtilis TaxID=1423 RepID=RIMM_BACSU|nr:MULTISPECIES: ribosome maturation factor RimM [Bacillales]NP_389484.1 16S rRNA processing protein [Bacillus subtilis subsp. subtilis str. 168]O31740.1 RecName: Full=Ribosome maturation factor RimM [Bacillus subtilis subsp. subtilis str. 168]AOL29546.1 ribosome maturation factor RimM [Alkalicoccobacillus gibsonii]AXC52882.1 ribosome maturation factor RimM [Bacillus spizizenii]MDP4099553.1 ribosome maturation factor RimM [Bacillota bacterium]BAM52248.1 16S rRNA-processing protein RimM [Bacil
MTKRWFNVGKIVNTHGIKGEVRVISKTDFAEERYKPGNTLYLFMDGRNEPVEVTVNTHRLHKQFHLLQFKERQNLNEVEELKNAIIKVPEEELGELNEGEFYFHEIIGCEVFTEEGELIGKVKEILTPGANDVWVIGRKGKKDALIPYIESVVKHIDVREKKIEIELMEGLIDE